MRKHWIKVVAAIGVILVAGILTGRYFVAEKTAAKEPAPATQQGPPANPSDECAQCHEMKPEVLTWEISAHDKFACTVCHTNKKAADYEGKHQSQAYSKPIKSFDAIPNDTCLQCHSSNRVTSPTGDLQIPHEKHLKAGVTCVKCHYGVVHAKIAERNVTSILPDPNDYEAWNKDIAKKVATKEYILPSMWTCIDCHKQANVTRKCGACHTTIPTLPSHDQPTWKLEHGRTARNDVGVCAKCHTTPGLPTFITPSTGDKATDFARAQEFCYKCHLQRPEMHEKTMVPLHPKIFAKRGIQNCQTCHDMKQPQANEKVPKTYCNQCHWFQN
ncbi:MAG TPA: cytochrome c3 family protein [Verrucomicrobiae bacterium]|nr:cytochrome c3 family protein [Verrucomicrobiae bacterium]